MKDGKTFRLVELVMDMADIMWVVGISGRVDARDCTNILGAVLVQCVSMRSG